MTLNRLSIHIANGDIFYENHNTGENFYKFLIDQQNEDGAFIPKKICLHKYVWKIHKQFIFLPAFSIDDIEKSNLYANKNYKYLFYHFNDYIKVYGSKRRKIKKGKE